MTLNTQQCVLSLFGPVVTIYVYDDNAWEETLHLS